METRRIAVFDVCGTITKTNNTSDFIGFVLRSDNLFNYLRLLFLRSLCLFCRVPGLRRLASDDSLRRRQIALLRGYSATTLRARARLYVDALFAQGLVNDRILEAIRREKEQGREIVLASAAVDPPIAAIAERLGVRDFVSSELDIADGLCSGRLRSDLLGRKQTVMDRIAATADLGASAVYSDNPEDAEFMESFAERYIVLTASDAARAWNIRDGEFRPFVNCDAVGNVRDVDAVNEKTATWVYIPLLYYVISRFHRTGLSSLLFREVVPAALVGFLFTRLGASAFILVPLSFVVFFCVYEIGGLANDLLAKKGPGRGDTRRIAPGVRIHVALFLSIRLTVVALILAWMPLETAVLLTYIGLLLLCLAVYLAHSLVAVYGRVVTFTLLKLCRNCIPLVILAAGAPPAFVVWLCAIFFLVDAPWRVCTYCRERGLIRPEASMSRMRRANAAILWGLGAVIWVVAGPPHLLAVASYHLVLECAWTLRAVLPASVSFGRNSVGRRS